MKALEEENTNEKEELVEWLEDHHEILLTDNILLQRKLFEHESDQHLVQIINEYQYELKKNTKNKNLFSIVNEVDESILYISN